MARKKTKKIRTRKKNKIYHEVTGVLLIGLGLFTFISLYTSSAGIVGMHLQKGLMGLFGLVAYIIPAFLLVIGFLSIIAYHKRINKFKLFLVICSVILAIIIVHLTFFDHFDWSKMLEFIYSSYDKGQEAKGTGALFAVFGFLSYKLFGLAGSYVFLFAFLTVNILLLTNVSLKQIGENIYEYIKPKEQKIKPKQDTKEQKIKPFIEETIAVDELKRDTGPEIHPLEEAFVQKEKKPLIKAQETRDDDDLQEINIVNPQKKGPGKGYTIPPIKLLRASTGNIYEKGKDKVVLNNAKLLEETLSSFGVNAKVTQISRGPVITRYELQPAPGVKVSRIVNLADDIALNLAAPAVRIEAPIPGKAAVGIEVPNHKTSPVNIRDVLESEEFIFYPSKLAFALGKDIAGKNVIADIAKMPHLLIAGATGSGKSVCINALITSILYKASPEEVKLIMIDPKVVELNHYNGVPHLLIPVVTKPKKAAGALNWAVQEMTSRYKLFADKGVRDIEGYNSSLEEQEEHLPQMVVIIDELADLMMVAPTEVEDAICRLAQMARAAGIHLVIATQRPSVDVITGLIKANIPSRIAFAVSSQVDSRTILDMGGAEKLLGRGDMLFHPVGANKPIRVQGSYISEKEVERIVAYIKAQNDAPVYSSEVLEEIATDQAVENQDDCDELFPEAVEIVIDAGQASISMLQRRLRIGYARAARIIDDMEIRGIVSGFEGSKPRNVLISREEFEELYMNDVE